MGQKVHPTGFRLGVIKKHRASWYAKGKSFKENLIEDLKVRDFLKKKLRFSSVSSVDIERSAQNFIVTINTSRPGIIIGKKGEEIEEIKKAIEKIFKVNVTKINIINKKNRTKFTRGRTVKVKGYKKAIVTLKKGQSIDLTTGI